MPQAALAPHLLALVRQRLRRSQEYDFGIGTPRVRESMLKQWLIHIPLGIPPIQIGREPL
jgi:hypothetical protein